MPQCFRGLSFSAMHLGAVLVWRNLRIAAAAPLRWTISPRSGA
jgi:hypothetical protein